MDVTMESRRRRTHGTPPDTMTAADWYAARRPATTPERRLLAVVLEDALDILHKYARYRHARGSKGRHVWVETQAWLMDGERTDTLGARPVCDVLGIDYDAMVATLARNDWLPAGQVARSNIVKTTADAGAGPGAARNCVGSPVSPRWVG